MTRLHQLLHQYWGYYDFRPLQLEIIGSVLAGHDTLALLPTGGGKSLTYQLAGLALGGVTVVVSPLIALMDDQVRALHARGIPAMALHSHLSARELDFHLNEALRGRYHFLYLSPERLSNALVVHALAKLPVRLLAVDEAHCISQWGYDFRPAYRQILAIRSRIQAPVLALTASATPAVQDDICTQLQMPQAQRWQQSFARPNLAYQVLPATDKWLSLQALLQQQPGAAIIYVRSRKLTEQLAAGLRQVGIAAAAYHAGLHADQRAAVQADWMHNHSRVIVATNAFGMGIDKPDVRLVVHWQLPPDLESYYQESGRAGRDGNPARAVALRGPQDLAQLAQQHRQQFPELDVIVQVYDALCTHYRVDRHTAPQEAFPFSWEAVLERTQLPGLVCQAAARQLEVAGLLRLEELPHAPPTIRFAHSPQRLADWKQQYPQFLAVVDALLRTVGGEAFEDPMPLDVPALCKLLGQPRAATELLLLRLHKLGVLVYGATAGGTRIQFLQPHRTLDSQRLDWDAYSARADRARQRLEALVAYAAEAETCRMRSLCAYFGEDLHANCGRCDVCRQ
jgi:ATP-dependent DNA helicase RecQ